MHSTSTITTVRDIRVLNALILLALVGLFLGYLALTTQTATKGYSIKGLESKIAALEDEKRRTDVEAAALQSLATVSSKVESLGLVPVSDVQYVSATAGAIASR